jgi:dolichyl-phosphate-mannose-protein mannosyltransferase
MNINKSPLPSGSSDRRCAVFSSSAWRDRRKRGLFSIFFSLLLAITGSIFFIHGGTTTGFLFMVGALIGTAYGSAISPWKINPMRDITYRWYRSGLIAIILVAALICCYRLASIPYRLTGWEVSGGISAIQLSQGIEPGYGKLLWSSLERPYNGAPSCPFLVYPLVGLIKLFGAGVLTIRITGVFWALASLIFLYYLVKNLFEPQTALLATFLTLISPWFLSIARLGNYISVSLCYVMAVLLFFTRATKGKLPSFFITGLLVSLFSYFYLPVKIIFPTLALIWLHYLILDTSPWQRKIAGILLFLLGFFLIATLIGNPFPRLTGVAMKGSFLGSPPGKTGFNLMIAAGDLKRNVYSLFYNLVYRNHSVEFPAPRGILINRGILLLAVLGIGWTAARWRNRSSFSITIASLMPLLPIMLTTSAFGGYPIARRGFLLVAFIPTLAAIMIVVLMKVGGLIWKRAGARVIIPLTILFILVTSIFSVTGYFRSPVHPYFSMKRYFAEHCVRLIDQGYYLELGESDYHLQELLDFLSYPRTKHLYTYYPYMGKQFTHRGRISDMTYYRAIGENPFYRFWTADDFDDVMARVGEAGRKTAILYEIEVARKYRPLLAEIAAAYPESSITELRDPENRIIGLQALVEGK